MPELRKIISVNPGGNFGQSSASVHLLWPCRMFTVTMPLFTESNDNSEKSLNVIEQCVLGLTNAGLFPAKIAGLMCVEEDLVAFVQDRLMKDGFLDENHEITERGRNKLGESSAPKATPRVFTVLKDCVAGTLIRHIHTGVFSFLDVIEDSGSTVKFLPDSQNRERFIFARSVFAPTLKQTTPKPSDIIAVIKRSDSRRTAPKASAVVVSPESEVVYLHCMALLPEAGSEILVTDGFGRPSERFARELVNSGAKWLDSLRSGATVRVLSNDDRHSRKAASYMRNVDALTKSITSTAELEANTEASSSAIREIYSGIEHALSEALQDSTSRGGKWSGVFGGKQSDSISNGRKFRRYAEEVGFTVDDNMAGLTEIPPGRFRVYDNSGSGDMWTLLALSSAQAHDDPSHPLRVIARKDPGFLKFIADLKEMRDSVSHGGTFSSNNPDFWNNVISRTRLALSCLLPAVQSDNHEESESLADSQAIARARLERAFGFSYVSDIRDKGLFCQLIRVEIMLEGEPDSDQCLEIVTSLASCLQLLAEERTRGSLMYRRDITDIGGTLAESVRSAGFTGDVDALMKTNTSRILRSMRGEGGTLGSSVAAFLLTEDEESLKSFAGLCPDFAAVASRLIVLRGHGSVWRGLTDTNEIRELREKVYRIIKIFGEEF